MAICDLLFLAHWLPVCDLGDAVCTPLHQGRKERHFHAFQLRFLPVQISEAVAQRKGSLSKGRVSIGRHSGIGDKVWEGSSLLSISQPVKLAL